jgi:hypothetical protein
VQPIVISLPACVQDVVFASVKHELVVMVAVCLVQLSSSSLSCSSSSGGSMAGLSGLFFGQVLIY